jgi:tetratricopeptide (TPR) repeat protein
VADDAAVRALHELAEQRHRDPAAVRVRVETQLADADLDPALAPVAGWVLGLALHEIGDLPAACDRLGGAAEAAHDLGDRTTEALARGGLAITLLGLGRTPAAVHEIEVADACASPEARARVDFLAGLVHQRLGQLDAALARYRTASRRVRRSGDRHTLARVLICRGILLAYRGSFDAALADLGEGEHLAYDLVLPVMVAMAAHNAGFALARQGAVSDALAAFDRAERAYDELGRPPRLVAVLASDRCDVLLQVGLVAEARAAAAVAVAALDGIDASHSSEARLLLAQACLADGDLDAAEGEASSAEAEFRRDQRGAWAALAGYVRAQAVVRASEHQANPSPALLAPMVAAARRLDEEGWGIEAVHARTFVGRIALAVGRPEVAERTLADATGARRRGPAGLRAQAWHATALVRLARDDRPGAKHALRRGLAVVDDYRATLGATELRAGAAAHAEDLARLGLRLALADGRAWEVLRWAERWRAGTLRLAPAEPPADPALARALADLRGAEADWREATLAGRAAPTHAARVARLERAVRDLARRAPAAGGGRPGVARGGTIAGAELRAALGDRALVELVDVEGALHAVVVDGDRARLVAVAPVPRAEAEGGHLAFAVRRALIQPGPGRAQAVAEAAARVDDLLVRPLGLDPARPVVLVPTSPLHPLPWGALPSFATRPVTIAPSAALWLHGRPRAAEPGRRTRARPRVVAVAGPDLRGAEAEAEAVLARHPGGRLLRGPEATVAGVLDALSGADVAHVAAHGRLRSDSPLFSALVLADGALTIYDVERLAAPPTTIVLPACDAASGVVARGDELLGTATALVGVGVRSVVAPVLPVPDAATTPVVTRIHEALAAGLPPGAALARARTAGGGGVDAAVAAAFLCIGADDCAPAR